MIQVLLGAALNKTHQLTCTPVENPGFGAESGPLDQRLILWLLAPLRAER
jgi:hypothetical protein